MINFKSFPVIPDGVDLIISGGETPIGNKSEMMVSLDFNDNIIFFIHTFKVDDEWLLKFGKKSTAYNLLSKLSDKEIKPRKKLKVSKFKNKLEWLWKHGGKEKVEEFVKKSKIKAKKYELVKERILIRNRAYDRNCVSLPFTNEGIHDFYNVSRYLVNKVNNLLSEFSLKEIIKHPIESNDIKDSIFLRIEKLVNMDANCLGKLSNRLVLEYYNEYKDKNLIDKIEEKFKGYSYMYFTHFDSTPLFPKVTVILKTVTNILKHTLLMDSEKYFGINYKNKVHVPYINMDFFRAPITKQLNFYRFKINKGKPYKDIITKSIKKEVKQLEEFYSNKGVAINVTENYLNVTFVNNDYTDMVNERIRKVNSRSFVYSDKFKRELEDIKTKGCKL